MTPSILVHSGKGFTTISNSTLFKIQDPAALGIYVYLASKPEKWVIRNKEIQSHFNKGRDFINDKMNYLKELGLISKHSIRDEGGKILSWETHLHYEPIQNTENPHSGETTIRKTRTHINKRDLQIKEELENNIYNAREDEQKSNNPNLSVVPYRETYYPTTTEDMMTMENFEHFWSIYPRQKNKGQAARQWAASKCEGMAYEIIEKLIEQIKHDEDFMQFTPMPANYIRDKRWMDSISKKRKPKSKDDMIRERDNNRHSTDWIKPMLKTPFAEHA